MRPHEACEAGPTAATERLLLKGRIGESIVIAGKQFAVCISRKDARGQRAELTSRDSEAGSSLPLGVPVKWTTLEVELRHHCLVNLRRRAVEYVAVEDDEVRGLADLDAAGRVLGSC